MTTDITGTELLEQVDRTGKIVLGSFDYYLSITGGDDNDSHNTIAKLVEKGDVTTFVIKLIQGIKHQAYHRTGKSNLIDEKVINELYFLINSFFKYYEKDSNFDIDTHKHTLPNDIAMFFDIKECSIEKIVLDRSKIILSNLKEQKFEIATVLFIFYLNNVFDMGLTVMNRLKSDFLALINQLDVNLTKIDSLSISCLYDRS